MFSHNHFFEGLEDPTSSFASNLCFEALGIWLDDFETCLLRLKLDHLDDKLDWAKAQFVYLKIKIIKTSSESSF